MSTPGRRRSLKALAKRRRINKERVAAGKRPLVTDPKTGKLKPTSASKLGIKRK